jgi:hypothetical protein
MTTNELIEMRRRQELAGEKRILKAKLRHAIHRACALTRELVASGDEANAIETILLSAFDHVGDQPRSVAPIELVRAINQLLASDLDRMRERAAA